MPSSRSTFFSIDWAKASFSSSLHSTCPVLKLLAEALILASGARRSCVTELSTAFFTSSARRSADASAAFSCSCARSSEIPVCYATAATDRRCWTVRSAAAIARQMRTTPIAQSFARTTAYTESSPSFQTSSSESSDQALTSCRLAIVSSLSTPAAAR